MLYRSIYIGNPAHLKLKDKQLKITDPTTQTVPKYAHALLSITKLQNLQAIHNLLRTLLLCLIVVINHKTIKFESNSQLQIVFKTPVQVVINHKTTKFESNSQQRIQCYHYFFSCYQSQNYKI